MLKQTAIILGFLLFFTTLLKSQDISGSYKISGDSYSSGVLTLSSTDIDSVYTFSLNKKTSDCSDRLLSGTLNFTSKGTAIFKPENNSASDTCTLIFKNTHDVISIIVNCENNLDYLCSFSGRYILTK